MWSLRKHGQSTFHTPASEMGDEDGGGTHLPDSPLERLLHAWHSTSPPDSAVNARHTPLPSREAALRVHASDSETILLCLPPGREIVVDGLEKLWPAADRKYRIASTSLTEVRELERLLTALEPRMLLIDAGLCTAWGAVALRHLHRAFPAADWIIGWHEPLHCPVDLLIHSQARGCVCWAARDAELMRAIQAVLSGELWFSRPVMQSIYLSLLGDRHLGNGHNGDSAPEAAAGLSAREVEVLALTRAGLTNKQIAARLDISINTVKKHLTHAFEKRGLRSRRQVIR